MKLNKFIVVLLILMLTIIPSISAAEDNVALGEGETSKDGTTIEMNRGEVTFEASQLKATAHTEIDGIRFAPANTKQIGDSLVWETGEKQYFIFDDPTVSMAYQYSGKKLKETITLKEDKVLSFPVSLGADSKLIPWIDGSWKIVSATSGNTMQGIVIEKPYGIDASGKRIEMDYTYVDGKLNLIYNRTITTYTKTEITIPAESGNATSVETKQNVFVPVYSEIAYPLVIDPTWTNSGSGWWSSTDAVPGYTVVNFTVVGSTTWTPPAGVTSIDYVVVGGGGGGGSSRNAGGGGAGGVKTGTYTSVSGEQTIVVGEGGAAGAALTSGRRGGTSSFGKTAGGSEGTSLFTSTGGGGGFSFTANGEETGGSGGGGQNAHTVGAAGIAGQGNDGGNFGGIDPVYAGGGGGGYSQVGTAGATIALTGGKGGDGYTSSLTGVNQNYAAGGGGGAQDTATTGGTGGKGTASAAPQIGGNGYSPTGDVAATPGATNTGSGGGGGGYTGSSAKVGAAGGSGIVIIRYATGTPAISISLSPSASSTSNLYAYATLTNASLNPYSTNPQNWTFGDTYTSQVRNSTLHWYSVAGNYTVNVSVTNTTAPFGFQNATTYFNQSSDVDVNVKTWMHMDGAAGGTSFPGIMGVAWTPSSVTTETSNKKFGTASALFNADNDRLSTPSTTAFNFGTGNLTIEHWVYPTASKNNVFIISRTSDSVARTDGWGVYHSTASATSDGWRAFFGATQTGTFSLPLNTWSFLAVQRINGVVNVSVNGVQVAQVTAAGNYDTANPVAYGDPVVGGGTTDSARMYIDEPRISTSERWNSGGTDFSPPWMEYRGGLFPTVLDPNPGSTLRFKTNPSAAPPGNAYIANLTPRQRTVQIQYVNISNNISTTVYYNPDHSFVSGVTANATTFTGINFTSVIIDPTTGTVLINATRPGGFSTIGLPENRASVADMRMVYWNYTEPTNPTIWGDDTTPNHQYFGSGFLGNSTYSTYFPVVNFLATNVTFLDWQTFSNFTLSTNTPIVNEAPVLFATRNNNFTANRFDWDFGDGTVANTTSGLTSHVYTAPGIYTVSSRAYLWQNTSVTNITTMTGSVNAAYNASYVKADFLANPIAGSSGVLVRFTDLSYFQTNSGKTYNWSFGDGSYSSNVGDVTHVYAFLGTFNVNLSVNNTLGSDYELKESYVTVSTNQMNTWYTPWQIRIRITDYLNNPLPGTTVTANYVSTSLPNTSVSWLMSAYGITEPVAAQMTNSGEAMRGVTDDNGGVSYSMFKSLQYNLTITNVTSGVSATKLLYPSDTEYNIKVALGGRYVANNTLESRASTSLPVYQLDATRYNLSLIYKDTSGMTSNVRFIVKSRNGTVFHDNDLGNPGIGYVIDNFTIANQGIGEEVIWMFNATRSV